MLIKKKNKLNTNFKTSSFLHSPEHFLGYLAQDKCTNTHFPGKWITQQEDKKAEDKVLFPVSSTQSSKKKINSQK
jgi:hypothetical protein